MQTSKSIWRLLARKLSNEATRQDVEELDLLIKDDTRLTYLSQVLTQCWKRSGNAETPGTDTDRIKKRIRKMTKKNSGNSPGHDH